MSDSPAQVPGSRTERYRDIQVRTPDGCVHPGRILRVSNESVSIAFRRIDAPDVDEHVLVALVFHPCDGGQLIARGRLVEERSKVPGERHLVFRFAAPHPVFLADVEPCEVDGACDPPAHNRRKAYRAIPQPRCTQVTVQPGIDRAKPVLRQLVELRLELERRTLEGWLLDISADGLGVLVPETGAHRYEVGDHATLTFDLAEGPLPLVLGAVVRQSRSVRVGTRYGFRFDPGTTEQYHLMQQAVLEFVMRLQRDGLRARSGLD